MTGFSDTIYASSLSEFGNPRELAECGGWILEREIPGTPYKDAMGCYPIFACKDWTKLAKDLYALQGNLVSLSLVTDPFGRFDPQELASIFDICTPFKQHFISDLSVPIEKFVRKRYRKYAKSALEYLSIEHCKEPDAYLDEWNGLYSHLIERHQIQGIQAFSGSSFKVLFTMPGVEMFVSRYQDEIVGADIWIIDGDIGYAHLSAISPAGYELRASYALYWTAIKHYSRSLRWLDHGGTSGVSEHEDGLSVFKRGWSSETRQVYFCGKILDREKYNNIVQWKGNVNTEFFPAYRIGEY